MVFNFYRSLIAVTSRSELVSIPLYRLLQVDGTYQIVTIIYKILGHKTSIKLQPESRYQV